MDKMSNGQNLKNEAYIFLKEHYLSALASVDEHGMPHVTPLYCIVDKNLDLYFTTNASGTKYRNINERPNVAMTFVDNDNLSCIQVRGRAVLIEDRQLEDRILTELWRLRFAENAWPIPPIRLFEKKLGSELRIVRVRPTQMTLARFTPRQNGRFTKLFQKVV